MLLYKVKTSSLLMSGVLLFTTFTPRSIDAQSPQTGLKFNNSQELNVGAVYSLLITENYQTDSGRCHGPVYVPDLQTHTRTYKQIVGGGVFVSRTTLPASGLRVIVRNVTSGIDQNPAPFTDREYDKTPTSEAFDINFGARHSGRHLVVRQGRNDFSYEIKQGKTVIESGSFSAEIRHQTQEIDRRKEFSSPFFSNEYVKDAECKRAYDERNERDRKDH